MPKPGNGLATLAAGFLALTAMHALNGSSAREVVDAGRSGDRPAPGATTAVQGAARQCAIYHARFGGVRAWLVKVMRSDVANYIVMEVSQGRRVLPNVETAWLAGAFSGAEAFWLGEFASAERALARAADLCPRFMRCRIGEENCGPGARSL
jgi:hypothetical protein